MHYEAMFSGDVVWMKHHLENYPDNINVCLDMRTPLIHAIYKEQLDVIDFLLSEGVSINVQDRNGNTAFCVACKYAINRDIIEKFIQIDVDEYEPINDFLENTPLHYAAEYSKDVNIIYLLIPISDPNARNYEGRNPLMCACENKNPEIIRALVNVTNNINSQDNIGKTALQSAVECKNYEAIKILIAAGANPHIPTNYGENCYHHVDRKSISILGKLQ